MKNTIKTSIATALTILISGCAGGGDTEQGSDSPRNFLGEAPVAIITSITQLSSGKIILDGTKSYDTDGEIIEYQWKTANGEGISSPNPTIEIDSVPIGDYIVELIVVDNEGLIGDDVEPFTATIPPQPPEPPVNENHPPIATPQVVKMNQDTELPITLTGTDADNDILTFSIVTQPTQGVITGSGANIIYTPNSGFIGQDKFSFKANDGTTDSTPASLVINVLKVDTPNPNNPPIATPQSVKVEEGKSIPITLSGTDADNDILTFSIVTQPTNGIISGSGANIIYTPNPNFIGSDKFSFKANDGTTDSSSASVSIEVFKIFVPNIPPVADAGKDQLSTDGSFTLDGSGSYDTDGSITKWEWEYTLPDGSTVIYQGETIKIVGFQNGTHTFGLTVEDNLGVRSVGDDVIITVKKLPNKAPVITGYLESLYIPATNPKEATQTADNFTATDDGQIQPMTYSWINITGNPIDEGVTPTINDADKLHPNVLFSCSDHYNETPSTFPNSNCHTGESNIYCEFTFELTVSDGELSTVVSNYFEVDYSECRNGGEEE